MNPTFPFGRPARATLPRARSAELFVLGAYPSALHIRWTPPKPFKPIKAVGVDLEPHPFWNGRDQEERIAQWKKDVGWKAAWGRAEPAANLNGPCGAWVDEKLLKPLGVTRDSAWITDCLHWYCASVGGAKRIADTYAPFADEHDLPKCVLPAHPPESQIVRDAMSERPRLLAELRDAAPARVVTLGNAALRVLRGLVNGDLPAKLNAGPGYGTPVEVTLEGRTFEVMPLAHPAAPKVYREAHEKWLASQGSK